MEKALIRALVARRPELAHIATLPQQQLVAALQPYQDDVRIIMESLVLGVEAPLGGQKEQSPQQPPQQSLQQPLQQPPQQSPLQQPLQQPPQQQPQQRRPSAPPQSLHSQLPPQTLYSETELPSENGLPYAESGLPSESGWCTGARVRVHGLKAAVQHNGKLGKLLGKQEAGREKIQLEEDGEGLLVRRANLELLLLHDDDAQAD